MARVLFLLLALATSIAGAGRLTTFAWDADPAWPVGTTVELEVNGVSVSGIVDTQYALDVPISPGALISARARAIPPLGSQCGEPLADCQPSAWETLAQTLPAMPYGLWAVRHDVGGPMAIARRGSANYSIEWQESSSASITKEPSVQVGDIIFIGVSAYSDEGANAGGTVSISGFSIVGGAGVAYETYGADGASKGTVFYRVVDGTEGSSFTINTNPNSGTYPYGSAVLIAFSGSSVSIEGSGSTDNASGTSPSAPSVTAAGSNTLLLSFYLYSDPASFTAPSGSDGSIVNSPQNTNGSAISWDAIASSGATGARIATLGASRDCLGVSVLLKETAGGSAEAVLPGISGAGAIGTIAASGGATKTPTGIAASGLIGSLSFTGGAIQLLSSLLSTSGAGLLSANGGAAIASIGTAAAGVAGVLSLTAGANITPVGIYVTGLVGTIFASAGGNVNVSLSSLVAVGNAGALALSGGVQQTIAGLAATAGIGAATAHGGGTAASPGVAGTGAAGAVSLSATALLNLLGASGTGAAGLLALAADAAVTLTGIGANGQVGTITVSAGATASVTLSGVASIGQIGTVSLSANAIALLTGIQALGQAGFLRLVELITPAGRLLLVESEGRLLLIEPEDRQLSIQSDGSNLNIS